MATRRFQLNFNGALWASFEDRNEALEYAGLLVGACHAKKTFDVLLTDGQDGARIFQEIRDGKPHEFPLVSATGKTITQEEIDEALDDQ